MAKVSWAQSASIASPTPTPTPPPAGGSTSSCPAPATNAFTGCYYSGENLDAFLLSRTDPAINFNWGDGSPDSKVPVDQFSAKWTGNFSFAGGAYTFTMVGDDGIALYIDGQLVINQWHDQASISYSATKTLSPGTHNITMNYYEAYGGAVAKLSWK